MDTRYEIILSAPFSKALNKLAAKDPDTVKRILAQLRYRLPLDPYPDEQGQDDIFHSTIVKNLEIDGYHVSRLKSLLFNKHRIFYLVDDDYNLIYVLEIALRDSTTYDRNSPHYRTIKTLYLEYFQNRGQ
jgi:mRNA-degrading endonuclease RelE of RelBE toxin-antitoxin system